MGHMYHGPVNKSGSHDDPGAAPHRWGMELVRDVQLTDPPPAGELGRSVVALIACSPTVLAHVSVGRAPAPLERLDFALFDRPHFGVSTGLVPIAFLTRELWSAPP